MFNKHPIDGICYLLIIFPATAYTGEGPTGYSADNNIWMCSYN